MLFPQVDGLVIEDITLGDEHVIVVAHAVAVYATCPECGETSGRVHSGYDRRLATSPRNVTQSNTAASENVAPSNRASRRWRFPVAGTWRGC
jgi:hypothetical protein